MPHLPLVYSRILRVSGLCLSSRMAASVDASVFGVVERLAPDRAVRWLDVSICDQLRQLVRAAGPWSRATGGRQIFRVDRARRACPHDASRLRDR